MSSYNFKSSTSQKTKDDLLAKLWLKKYFYTGLINMTTEMSLPNQGVLHATFYLKNTGTIDEKKAVKPQGAVRLQ